MKIWNFIFLHSETNTHLLLKNLPSDLPFHPIFVHFPIVLTILIPILAILVLIKFRNDPHTHFYWNFIIILNFILVIFSYFALFTGDIEHELLEHSPFLKQAIEQHETIAESYFVITIFLLAISFLGHNKFSFYKIMRILTIIIYFLVAIPLVLFTANLGGKIVYELDAPFFRKKLIQEYKEQINPPKEHNH